MAVPERRASDVAEPDRAAAPAAVAGMTRAEARALRRSAPLSREQVQELSAQLAEPDGAHGAPPQAPPAL